MGAKRSPSLLRRAARREAQDPQLEATLPGEEEPVGRTVHPIELAPSHLGGKYRPRNNYLMKKLVLEDSHN